VTIQNVVDVDRLGHPITSSNVDYRPPSRAWAV
jgi:hypothetical protein